jgi:RNA polymerase sigma-70 factor (ECF subfamily)
MTHPHEQFLGYYSQHQRQIHALIASLIPNAADVQDVLHETTLVLWRDFAKFDPERSFLKWACGVAFNVVRSHRRKRRDLVLPLDDDLMALLVAERQALSDTLDERRAALGQCLQKLRPVDRQLVVSCYAGEDSARAVAERLGRPVGAVYQSLGRIRRALMECIERSMKRQEGHRP